MKNSLTPILLIAVVLISCKNEAENQTPKAVVPFYQMNTQQQTAVAPPASQSLYQPTAAQNTTTQVQTNAPVKVGKGMNPAHGQPGHRCDIPVGAPLNTPVTATPTTSKVVSSNNITVTPNPTTTVQTPKGMNPPHGQPGHRCDIAVGAPLNSPPPVTTPAPTQTTPTYTVATPAASETPVASPAETVPAANTSGQ